MAPASEEKGAASAKKWKNHLFKEKDLLYNNPAILTGKKRPRLSEGWLTSLTKIERLRQIIDESKNLCVFTGAGISCPSGIPDFRAENGIYSMGDGQYAPEEIVSHSFFLAHPDLFYEFYQSKMLYPDAKPNAAHYYIAGMESDERHITVVTQNIDGLHQAAGSTTVLELHGSALRNTCMRCGRHFGMEAVLPAGVPHCPDCGGIIRPDVVLYEEPLDEQVVARAIAAIRAADAMLVIGTSLVVYPAAMYVRYFRGEHLVLINKSETSYDGEAELIFHEDVIRVVSALKMR